MARAPPPVAGRTVPAPSETTDPPTKAHRSSAGTAFEGTRFGLGDEGSDGELVGPQILSGDALQVVGRRRPNCLEVGRLGAMVPGSDLEAPDLVGETRDALALEVLCGEEIGARLVRYEVGNRLPTLLRCRSIEKLAHPAHVQLCPAVRALLVTW